MEIAGLPLHALILHATVVLLPLTALLAIAFAVLPKWRWLSRWPAARPRWGACPSSSSRRSPARRSNATVTSSSWSRPTLRAATCCSTSIIVFAVVVVAAAFVLPGPSGLTSGKGAMARRVAYADKVLPVLVVVAAVVVLVQVFLTGDSGARAVWGD